MAYGTADVRGNDQTGGTAIKKVYLFIAGAAVIFGTMEVALKYAGGNFDPFQITFLRFLLGGLVLVPFAVGEYKHQPKGFMTRQLWLSTIFLGAVNVPFCMVFFQFGVVNSNAATAAVIFCSNPVFTIPFAHLMTSDEKMNRYKALAMAIGAAGLVLMIRPWDIQEGNTLAGTLFSLAAAASFGFYSVLGGKTVGRVGVFTQTCVSFISGAIIILCILLALGHPVFEGTAGHIGIILYISIVVTGGGYLFYFLTIKNSNATTASIIFFLKPVIAPVFAVLLLGEIITYNMYIGIALILIASYILIFRKPG